MSGDDKERALRFRFSFDITTNLVAAFGEVEGNEEESHIESEMLEGARAVSYVILLVNYAEMIGNPRKEEFRKRLEVVANLVNALNKEVGKEIEEGGMIW